MLCEIIHVDSDNCGLRAAQRMDPRFARTIHGLHMITLVQSVDCTTTRSASHSICGLDIRGLQELPTLHVHVDWQTFKKSGSKVICQSKGEKIVACFWQ